MALPKLTKLELQIMETLWTQGACSVREIHQAFPDVKGQPLQRCRPPSIAWRARRPFVGRNESATRNIFEAVISRDAAQSRLVDELLTLFGGRTKPVMAHLIQSGKLTLDDIKDAEQAVRALARKDKKP